MKRAFLSLVLLSALSACTKNNGDNTPPPTPPPPIPTVTGPAILLADIARDYTANKTVHYIGITQADAGALTIPTADTGQVWNFSGVTAIHRSTVTFGTPNNLAFPTATFTGMEWRNYFGTAGSWQTIFLTTYSEVSSAGWMELGRSLPALNHIYANGSTLAHDPQNSAYVPRMPVTPPFPVQLNDSVNINSVITERYNATAAGFNEVPLHKKTRFSGKVKATGTGTISLPEYSAPLKVMVLRRDLTITENYLVNGAPASPALLQAFGYTEGRSSTLTYYDFYNYGGIGHVGTLVVQYGYVILGSFRRAN